MYFKYESISIITSIDLQMSTIKNPNVYTECDSEDSEIDSESDSYSKSDLNIKKQNNTKPYNFSDEEDDSDIESYFNESNSDDKVDTCTPYPNQTENSITDPDLELNDDLDKGPLSSPILHSIQNIYVHTKKQVTASSQKFDEFITFITEFTPYTDQLTVLKYTFYLGCTVYPELGEFMLKNSKCNDQDQVLTDILPHCKISALHEICKFIGNDTLFEYFITCVPNHMTLLTKSYPLIEPALFLVDSLKKLTCLCGSKDFNKSILTDVTHNGRNYFQTISRSPRFNVPEYILSLDMCTSDVILYGHEHEPLDYVMRLFKKYNSPILSAIKSGKLPDYIFDLDYQGKPAYITLMDVSDRWKNRWFIQSPHCTIERATAYLNYKYKNWDVYSGKGKKPNDTMKYIFDCDKFKCLKDKFYDETSVLKTSTSNDSNIQDRTKKTRVISKDDMIKLLDQVKNLKSEIAQLKKSI